MDQTFLRTCLSRASVRAVFPETGLFPSLPEGDALHAARVGTRWGLKCPSTAALLPGCWLAQSHSLSHRTAAHRCPAGNPKAAGCLNTECWLPPGPPAHSCLRKVEPLTPRAACTHGARVPLGTGHSLKQSRAQGWETLPLTCPKAAERCARGTAAVWLLPARGESSLASGPRIR